MAANKNAAPYAVDTWPLLWHAEAAYRAAAERAVDHEIAVLNLMYTRVCLENEWRAGGERREALRQRFIRNGASERDVARWWKWWADKAERERRGPTLQEFIDSERRSRVRPGQVQVARRGGRDRGREEALDPLFGSGQTLTSGTLSRSSETGFFS